MSLFISINSNVALFFDYKMDHSLGSLDYQQEVLRKCLKLKYININVLGTNAFKCFSGL